MKFVKKILCYCFLSLLLSVCLLTASSQKRSSAKQAFHFFKTITVDGLERTYLVNLPPRYYQDSGFSLVIAMHGGGGKAEQFEESSLLSEKGNAAGFIVVYPEGVRAGGILHARSWNAGTCCYYAVTQHIDDVHFISTLIDTLLADYTINRRKVYVTGHSNGGMMAYRLACELPQKIAAIAANSCTMVVTQPCNAGKVVPVLHMHSVLDKHVPVAGGIGIGPGSGSYYPPVDSVLNVWAKNDGCTSSKIIKDDAAYQLTQWYSAAGKVLVAYYLTKDGGHAWPGGHSGRRLSDTPSTVINADNLLWAFFQQFELPAAPL